MVESAAPADRSPRGRHGEGIRHIGRRGRDADLHVTGGASRGGAPRARARPHKLRVIPNGIDRQQPVTARDRAAVRSQLGIDDDTVLGLFVGELEPNKAPLLAASATVAVRAAGTGSCLLSQAPALRRRSSRPSRLTRCGAWLSRRCALAAGRRRCIRPARRSARECRSALLEAMAPSLPVIAADSPGAPEVDRRCRPALRNGSGVGLGGALEEVSADPALRAFARCSRETRALQEFSAASFRSATAEVYIASPRPPPSLSGGSLRHVRRSPTP